MEISTKRPKNVVVTQHVLLPTTGLKGKTLSTASKSVGAMTKVPNTGPNGKAPLEGITQ